MKKAGAVQAVVTFVCSLLAIVLIENRLGDQTPIPWFAGWTFLFAFFMPSVTLALASQSRATSRKVPVTLGLGVVAFAFWIIAVAAVGLVAGLFAHRILNPSALTSWALGATAGLVTQSIVRR